MRALDHFLRKKIPQRGIFTKNYISSQRMYKTLDAKRSINPWARIDSIVRQKEFRTQPSEIAMRCWKRMEARMSSVQHCILRTPSVCAVDRGTVGDALSVRQTLGYPQCGARNSKETPRIKINKRAPWEAAGEGSPRELIYNPASTGEAFLKSIASSLTGRGGLCRVLEVSWALPISSLLGHIMKSPP